MKKKTLWIVQTAVMLAMLIVLQAVTKPLGQLVTGSCVNAVLAVTVLFCGFGSGMTVAVISPLCAFLLGIAPQIITVPAIMVSNAAFVTALWLIAGSNRVWWKSLAAVLIAALCKFLLLYVLVTCVICGLMANTLLEQGLLKAPMLKTLPTMFSTIQLVTALIGGGLAMAIVPVLKKALYKN